MFRRISRLIRTRRRHRTMHAADEEAFESLLDQVGLLSPLMDGQLTCYLCDEPLDRQTVQGLRRTRDRYVVFCSRPECSRATSELLERRNRRSDEGN